MSDNNDAQNIIELDADVLAHYMDTLASSLSVVHDVNAQNFASMQTSMQQIADRMARLQESVRAGIDDNTKTSIAAIELAEENYKTALHRLQFKPSEREDISKKIENLQRELNRMRVARDSSETNNDIRAEIKKLSKELVHIRANTNALFWAAFIAMLGTLGALIALAFWKF